MWKEGIENEPNKRKHGKMIKVLVVNLMHRFPRSITTLAGGATSHNWLKAQQQPVGSLIPSFTVPDN